MGFFSDLFGGSKKGTDQAAQTIQNVAPPPPYTDYPVNKRLEEIILEGFDNPFGGVPSQPLIDAQRGLFENELRTTKAAAQGALGSAGMSRAAGAGASRIGQTGIMDMEAQQRLKENVIEAELKKMQEQSALNELIRRENFGLGFGANQATQGNTIANFNLNKGQQLAGLQQQAGQFAQQDAAGILGLGTSLISPIMSAAIGGASDLLGFLRSGSSGANAGFAPGFISGSQGLTGSIAPSTQSPYLSVSSKPINSLFRR